MKNTRQQNERISIVFILPSFHTGGSERVILHLLNNLNRERFRITLIALKREGSLLDELPKDIEIIFYNYSRVLFASFSLFKEIRKRKNSIIFSTLNQVNLLISTFIRFAPHCTFICRESSIASHEIMNSRNPGIFKLLYRTSFHRFHSVICQSDAMMQDLARLSGISRARLKIINNPVDGRLSTLATACIQKTKMEFITVGQLRKEKGHDRILKMLSKCTEPFRYTIIGDGPMRPFLADLVAEYGLQDKVRFLGSLPSPYPHVAAADAFLQGSHYEGFPNAVLEANALGIPALVLSAPGGHNEIVINGVNGWITSEQKLLEIIHQKLFLKLDREKIINLTTRRYELRKIVGEYESHLMAVFNTRRTKQISRVHVDSN